MKKSLLPIGFLFSLLLFFSFIYVQQTENCLLNFKGTPELRGASAKSVAIGNVKTLELPVSGGMTTLSVREVYRQDFYDTKFEPFATINIEYSDSLQYGKDTLAVLQSLRYTNSIWKAAQTSELIEMEFNGYKVYGKSIDTMGADRLMGHFVFFPGKGARVSMFFTENDYATSAFSDLDEYRNVRNEFIAAYIKHIRECK